MSHDSYEMIDFIDLLDYTFSNDFIEKWRYRFSTGFLQKFQFKLLSSINEKKVLKRKTLMNYLTKKCKYSEDQVSDFFKAIDIDNYYPFVN